MRSSSETDGASGISTVGLGSSEAEPGLLPINNFLEERLLFSGKRREGIKPFGKDLTSADDDALLV